MLLIVDNDVQFSKFVLETARHVGFKGLITASGAAALALVSEYQPHAVILDISLPDIDGWRVLKRLKHDLSMRHIPVFVVSTVDHPERGLQLGAQRRLAQADSNRAAARAVFGANPRIRRPHRAHGAGRRTGSDSGGRIGGDSRADRRIRSEDRHGVERRGRARSAARRRDRLRRADAATARHDAGRVGRRDHRRDIAQGQLRRYCSIRSPICPPRRPIAGSDWRRSSILRHVDSLEPAGGSGGVCAVPSGGEACRSRIERWCRMRAIRRRCWRARRC